MPTIDLKTAVSAATNYLESLQDIVGNLGGLRLEEVELSEDKKYWLITLGFDVSTKSRNPLGINFTPEGSLMRETNLLTREYKLFKVNSETGEVEAMKIRKV